MSPLNKGRVGEDRGEIVKGLDMVRKLVRLGGNEQGLAERRRNSKGEVMEVNENRKEGMRRQSSI
jgi:hypothetical protein